MNEQEKKLLEIYLKGFNDELNGSSSIVEGETELRAYKLGAIHAVIGDDIRSVDYLSDEEILNIICPSG